MLKHELWKSVDEDGEGYLFCLAGKHGDNARTMFKKLEKNIQLIWTCDANSHFDAMTQYYKYQGWGEYKTDYLEEDKKTYKELGYI